MLVDEIVGSTEHVFALYNKLQERKRKSSDAVDGVGGLRFKKNYGAFGLLLKEEKEFNIHLVTALSDLTPQNCIELLKVDEYAMAKCLTSETQINLSTKLSDALMTRDVFWRVMMKLSLRYDRRLQHAKTKGIVGHGNRVNILAISPYKFSYSETHYTGVTYKGCPPNTPGTDFAKLGLALDYGLKDLHTDLEAPLCKPPLKPTKLEAFFMKTTGPKSMGPPTKGDLLESLTVLCLQEYTQEMQKSNQATTLVPGDANGSKDTATD